MNPGTQRTDTAASASWYTRLENHFNLQQLIFVQKKSLTHTITDSPYKVRRDDLTIQTVCHTILTKLLQHIPHTAMICWLTWPLPHDTTNTISSHYTLLHELTTATSINQSFITTDDQQDTLEVWNFDSWWSCHTITRSSALPKNLPLILSRQPKMQCLLSMENRGSNQLEAIPARS